MPGGRPRDPNSLRSLAAKYDVSQESVRRWKEAGVDVTDEAEVRRFREGETSSGDDIPTFTEAKRLHEIDKRQLTRLKIAQEEGRLVPVEEVEEAGVRIGVVVKQSLLRLENDLPPQLEGLSAARMKKALREVLRNLLREWENFMEEAIGDAQAPN